MNSTLQQVGTDQVVWRHVHVQHCQDNADRVKTLNKNQDNLYCTEILPEKQVFLACQVQTFKILGAMVQHSAVSDMSKLQRNH